MDVDELARSPLFERALGEALGGPGSASARSVAQHRVRDKRFRVGPVRFRGWGLTILVAVTALLIAATGGVAAVTLSAQERVEWLYWAKT